MYLRQPGVTYSACGSFTKRKERTKKSEKQAIQDIFIETNQIKLVYDLAYGDFKDFNRRTFADKILLGKEFNIT